MATIMQDDARRAEKLKERANSINLWVDSITREAIRFNDDEIDGDITGASIALKKAVIDLFNAVTGDGE